MNRICKCLFSIGAVLASSRVFALKDDPVCRIAERSLKDLAKTTCNTFDLEPELCKTGISYLQDEKRLEAFSRAEGGSLPVYLLSDQLVAKHFGGSETNSDRRKKDEIAFRFIEGGFHRLKVPASCLYGLYSINERLPIMNAIHAGSLYYLHPDAFTEAVEEFTLFFMQHPIRDLTSYRRFMPSDRPTGPRFDNLVPYLVKEGDRWVGYIGLVDLEHLDLEHLKTNSKPSPSMAQELILLFPHHYNTIMRLVQDSFPGISFEERKDIPGLYLAECERAPSILQQYGNHEKLLQEKGVLFTASLLQAAEQESLDVLDRLLSLPNTSAEAKEEAFLEMVRRDHVKGVEKLLKSGGLSSQIQEKALLTVLQSDWSVFRSHNSILKLLECGEINDPQVKVEAFIALTNQDFARKQILKLYQEESLLQYIKERGLLRTREDLLIALFINAVENENWDEMVNFFNLPKISEEIKGKALIAAVRGHNFEGGISNLLKIGGIPAAAQKEAFEIAIRQGQPNLIREFFEAEEVLLQVKEEVFLTVVKWGNLNLTARFLETQKISQKTQEAAFIEAVKRDDFNNRVRVEPLNYQDIVVRLLEAQEISQEVAEKALFMALDDSNFKMAGNILRLGLISTTAKEEALIRSSASSSFRLQSLARELLDLEEISIGVKIQALIALGHWTNIPSLLLNFLSRS